MMVKNRLNLDRLTRVIDVGNDFVFIAANIEDGRRSARLACCDIRLTECRFGLLEITPARSPGELEPHLKRGRVLFPLRLRFPKLPEFLSADHIHRFTLCEVLG